MQHCWRLPPIRPTRWDSVWPAIVLESQRSAVVGYLDTRFGILLITFDNFYVILHHKTYSLLSATRHIEQFAGFQIICRLATALEYPAPSQADDSSSATFGSLACRHVYWSCLRPKALHLCTNVSSLCTSISNRGVCDAPPCWSYSWPWSLHTRPSALTTATARCRLVLGIDNGQPFMGANKFGTI